MMSTSTAIEQRPTADASEALSLPMVIAGERIETRGRGETRINVGCGTEVTYPAMDAGLAERLLAQDRLLLAELPLQDILAFLNRVGQNWRSEEYTRRRLYVRQLQEVLGYSEKAAESEADWIGVLLASHARTYDIVENELGSRFVLDRWIPRDEAEIRAFPLGLTVHVLPGNVPLSAVVSMLRALVTKNLCVAKWGSGDPITPLQLALSFLDVDPRHPVARATSVVHWAHDDLHGAEITEQADGLCVWGGGDAVEAARARVGVDASFLAFGPKRSVALVGTDAVLPRAALGVAHDVCAYEQRGCFSVQRVFVERPVEPFVAALRDALDEYRSLLPPARRSYDEAGRINLALLEETYLGAEVIAPPDGSWAIVVGPAGGAPTEHPQGRVVYVHPVDELREVGPFVGNEVQTVSCAPWERLAGVRDELARLGVSRFVEAGLSSIFRVGGSHDGLLPLTRLVRMVSTEAPARVHGKGAVLTLDQTELLRAGKLRGLIL